MKRSPFNFPQRLAIYSKDIQIILGCSGRTARRIIQDIKEELGKKQNEVVTIIEFCKYKGLVENLVRELLID